MQKLSSLTTLWLVLVALAIAGLLVASLQSTEERAQTQLAGETTIGIDLQASTDTVVAGSVPTGTSLSPKDALEAAIVEEINRVRLARGIRTLTVPSALAQAATRHANSMGKHGYFRHELYTPSRRDDRQPFGTWIHWYWPGSGYSSWNAGENLAWGAPAITAKQTIDRWLNSDTHRRILLGTTWRNVAVAVVHVVNPPGYWRSWNDVDIVVAEFGRRS
jgi:uncharacterized protein YkwD